eukprot:gene13998-18774_t
MEAEDRPLDEDDYNNTFDVIHDALKGRTVIEVPRVSRETIISVLGTHTQLIKGLRKDFLSLSHSVTLLDQETKANKRQLHILNDENERNKTDVINLFKLSAEFRKEMDELSQKVTDLYILKKQMNEQKEYVEQLTSKFNKFNGEVTEFISATSGSMETLQTNFSATDSLVKELKEYVDHFGDNLVLSSTQITVESSAGFAPKPMNLFEILKNCNVQFGSIEQKAIAQSEEMAKMSEEIQTKAPDSILFNVAVAEKKIQTIEVHLQKEEEQGIGAIRKACDELMVNVQAMSADLADKVDRESVSLIVHEKYEEIVRYLQDALQSSVEDENNFKQKADEIHEMVVVLMNTKADRVEIANMQELMVKSEGLLKKVSGSLNIKDRLKEFYSRKELDVLLDNKVDKNEMDEILKSVGERKPRRRGLGSSTDELANISRNPTITSTSADMRDKDRENSREDKRNAGVGRTNSLNERNFPSNLTNNAYNQNQDNGGGRYDPRLGYGNPNVVQVDGEDSGGEQINSQLPPLDRLMNGISAMEANSSTPVMAMGISLSKGMSNPTPQNFGTYVKGKKGGIASNKGAFRAATEGGRAGGDILFDDNINNMNDNYYNGNNTSPSRSQRDEDINLALTGSSFIKNGNTNKLNGVVGTNGGGTNAGGGPLSVGNDGYFGSNGNRSNNANNRVSSPNTLSMNIRIEGVSSTSNKSKPENASDDPATFNGNAVNISSTNDSNININQGNGSSAYNNANNITNNINRLGPAGVGGNKNGSVVSTSSGGKAGIGGTANVKNGSVHTGVPGTYPLDYQQQSAVTDHLAYLNGPMVGGGYNGKTHYIQHATPAALTTVAKDDVEGKGMMMKGADGHLYYKDLQSESGTKLPAIIGNGNIV